MYPIADCLAPNTEAVRISITTPMMYAHALGLTVNWFSPKTLIGKLGVWGMIEGELPGQEGLVGVIATGPITDLPVDNKGKKNTRYVFGRPDNKHEIKNAIEGNYKVDVLSVNVIKIPAKNRRLGRTEGFRKAFKKAVVKIKEGQKIEIL